MVSVEVSGKKKSSDPIENAIASLEERVNVLGRAVLGSESVGKVMSTAVSTRGRLQKGFSNRMAKNLNFYNMPSQEDVMAIAEQVGRLEQRMIVIEEMLRVLVEDKVPPVRKGPARTKKPKSKTSRAKS